MLMIKQYIWYAVGVVFLILCITIGIQVLRINSLKGDLLESQKREAVLQDSMKKQNALVKSYIAKGEEAKAQAQAAEQLMVQEHAKSQAKINALMAQKIPTGSAERIDYTIKTLQDLNTEWEK